MLQHIRPAVVLLILFSALTGLVYPLAITGIAQLAMPAPPTAASSKRTASSSARR